MAQCDATSKRTGQRCKRTPCPGLAKCSTHCGLSKTERQRAAEDARLLRQATAELARLDVQPVTNSLAELQWVAGVARAWLETAARLVNKLSDDAIRYEGRLQGEQLRAEILLLERSIERVANINTRIAKLGLDERLTTIHTRDGHDILNALNATLRDIGISSGDAWRAAHLNFGARLRALHKTRQVQPSPYQAIPGEVIPPGAA